MSLREQYAWVASRTIDATTTTMDFPTNGAPFVLIEVLSSSSLSVKAGVMGKAGTDRKVRSFLLSGASTETQVDPDTATGTVAAQDFLLVPSLGAKTVRITRAAGSGTMQGVACPSDAISAWVLMKILDGGLSASITQPEAIIGPGDPVIDSYTSLAINLTTGANQVLVAGAANKQIWVYGYGFTVGDADGQTVSLEDEAASKTGIMEFKQYGGIARNPSGNFAMPLFKCATDSDLRIDITGGDVDGDLQYAIVSV